MASRAAVPVVVVGTVLIALAYAAAFLGGAGAWTAWPMIGGIATISVGMLLLGTGRPGGLGGLGWVFGFVFVVLVGCFGGALLLPAKEGPGSALFAGLPVRAALVLLGVGLLPTLVLPVAYALTFKARTLSAEDLERIRRATSAPERSE